MREIPLVIRSGAKAHRFTAEVAATQNEQFVGMMYRRSLAPDRGMLFPFPEEKVAGFWMLNTLIPLDMIFICADGTIARVATAEPQSLETVSSEVPVAAVLEIAGGRSAQLGIRAGDRVEFRL